MHLFLCHATLPKERRGDKTGRKDREAKIRGREERSLLVCFKTDM